MTDDRVRRYTNFFRRSQATPGVGRGRRSFVEAEILVSVVIGTYNRDPFLRKAIDSVRRDAGGMRYEMIVVDGGSSDGSPEWLIRQPDIITIVQHNRGDSNRLPGPRRSWGYFMNLGFRSARGRYILMLSDDCLLLRDALARGVERFMGLEAAGRRVGGIAFYFRNWPREHEYRVNLTLGGKLMVNHGLFSRRVLEHVGWADEDRYIFYKADGDLSLKMWNAGYEVVDCPGAFIEHYAEANPAVRKSNMAVMDHDRRAYLERWYGIFYHPGRPDPRGSISMHFEDPHHTAEAFLSELASD